MITFDINIKGINKLIRSFDKLDASLSDLRVPLQAASEELDAILEERFDSFQAYSGTYKDKRYQRKKMTLPVGVRTGKLKKAFLGGPGSINEVDDFAGIANALLRRGIDLTQFDRGYPKYFAKWLQERGEELMALEDENISRVMNVFGTALQKQIEQAWA